MKVDISLDLRLFRDVMEETVTAAKHEMSGSIGDTSVCKQPCLTCQLILN